MRTFEKKWGQLANINCRVIINHTLFDKQSYKCDMLQIINDEHRIGIVIKNREIFVYKQDVVNFWFSENICAVCDKMMTISIVNKL